MPRNSKEIQRNQNVNPKIWKKIQRNRNKIQRKFKENPKFKKSK